MCSLPQRRLHLLRQSVGNLRNHNTEKLIFFQMP